MTFGLVIGDEDLRVAAGGDGVDDSFVSHQLIAKFLNLSHVRRVRHVQFIICHPVTLANYGLTVTRYENRAAKTINAHGGVHILVNFRGDLLTGLRCGGRALRKSRLKGEQA